MIKPFHGIVTYSCLQNEQSKFDKIASMGANVVRLAFWKNAVEGSPIAPCIEGISGLDKSIQYAANAGLKIILDEHIWSYQVNNCPPEFFTDITLQNNWLDMWRLLINRYKNNPTVIGIDLMNEPWAVSGNTPARALQWEAIAKNAVTALHPLNPDLIIYIPTWGIQTQPPWTDIDFLKQSNVAITDHVYGQRTLSFLNSRYIPYTSQGIPVWLGEIGFTASEESFMESQLNSYDQLGLSYTLFAVGINSWNSPYDIVDASYNLTSIGKIYSDHILKENAMSVTVQLTGISSGNTPATPISIVAEAADPSLFTSIIVNYIDPATTGNIVITPKADANGTTPITVTVNNGQPKNNILTRIFQCNVKKINPPTLDIIPDITVIS